MKLWMGTLREYSFRGVNLKSMREEMQERAMFMSIRKPVVQIAQF